MSQTDPTPISPAISAPDAQDEAARLAEAFLVFNQASEELADAYTALQSQVVELTSELAAANGALRQQYLEKLALTERLALLINAMPAGVVLIDAASRVMQANPAAEQILNTSLLERDWQALSADMLHPSDVPGEFLVDERRVAMTVTELDSGGVRIVLLNDVSETHELKQQAGRNQRLAAMGEMAAQLAHQLRTPLAAALLYTGNLELPELPDATRISIAGKAVGRLKHLERLIQDMLLFARGEVLGREGFDVAALLDELRHTFEPLARERNVSFSVADVPPAWQMTGNRKSLAGALTNLLENAFEAVQSKVPPAFREVKLTVSMPENQVEFLIEDSGRGIPPETLARLFEPFYTTRNEGTGLGLAIARGVARAHGGGIAVSSVVGEGTRFVMHVQRAALNSVEEPVA